MAEMREIHFEKGEQKTQYALMIRQGSQWAVFCALWAWNDDDAKSRGQDYVNEITDHMSNHKNSVFTVMKMLSTNGTEDM